MTPREKFNKIPEKCKDCEGCILIYQFETIKCDDCRR